VGFRGRFFAEAMEEVDSGPPEVMAAIGAGPLDIITCATLPMAMPSLINTSLFALEKAVRSSVVLDLVGARAASGRNLPRLWRCSATIRRPPSS